MMKKAKFLSLVAAGVLALGSTFGLAGCGGPKAPGAYKQPGGLPLVLPFPQRER